MSPSPLKFNHNSCQHNYSPNTHTHTVKDCDRMSLVTYDSSVTVNFSLMNMDKPNKSRAKALVESIKEGSCTNLCGGLLKGVLLIYQIVHHCPFNY